jgi:hypothetical protein
MKQWIWMLPLLAAGCGGHFSTQDAYTACEELLDRIDTASEGDESFNECVACFENCGDDCQQTDVVEGTFACPVE